jgi:hypothetical protein
LFQINTLTKTLSVKYTGQVLGAYLSACICTRAKQYTVPLMNAVRRIYRGSNSGSAKETCVIGHEIVDDLLIKRMSYVSTEDLKWMYIYNNEPAHGDFDDIFFRHLRSLKIMDSRGF